VGNSVAPCQQIAIIYVARIRVPALMKGVES
jgi:hypothetical protein